MRRVVVLSELREVENDKKPPAGDYSISLPTNYLFLDLFVFLD
jgi:hypothetical protein